MARSQSGPAAHRSTATYMPDNGICERFHRTMLDAFGRTASRMKLYRSIEELQAHLDAWLADCNASRPHQGRWCWCAHRHLAFGDQGAEQEQPVLAGEHRQEPG